MAAWSSAIAPAILEDQRAPLERLGEVARRLASRLQANIDARRAELAAAAEEERAELAAAEAHAQEVAAEAEGERQTLRAALRQPITTITLAEGDEGQLLVTVTQEDAAGTSSVIAGLSSSDIPGLLPPATAELPALVRPSALATLVAPAGDRGLARYTSADGPLAPAWSAKPARAALTSAVGDAVREATAPAVEDVAAWLVETAPENQELLRAAHVNELDNFRPPFAAAADDLVMDDGSEHLTWTYFRSRAQREAILAIAAPSLRHCGRRTPGHPAGGHRSRDGHRGDGCPPRSRCREHPEPDEAHAGPEERPPPSRPRRNRTLQRPDTITADPGRPPEPPPRLADEAPAAVTADSVATDTDANTDADALVAAEQEPTASPDAVGETEAQPSGEEAPVAVTADPTPDAPDAETSRPAVVDVPPTELVVGERVRVSGNNTQGHAITREGYLLAEPRRARADRLGERVTVYRLHIDPDRGAEPVRSNLVSILEGETVQRLSASSPAGKALTETVASPAAAEAAEPPPPVSDAELRFAALYRLGDQDTLPELIRVMERPGLMRRFVREQTSRETVSPGYHVHVSSYSMPTEGRAASLSRVDRTAEGLVLVSGGESTYPFRGPRHPRGSTWA